MLKTRAFIIFLIVVAVALAVAVVFLLGKDRALAPIVPPLAELLPLSNTTSTEGISVSLPQPETVIKSPLAIEGQAVGPWYFEAQFNAVLFDASEKELGLAILTAQSDWMTEKMVPFKGELKFPAPQTATGTLFFLSANPSGLEEHQKIFSVPVRFNLSGNVSRVKAFFGNSRLDPEISCVKVFPAEREIEKTQKLATAAILELLKGPLDSEKSQGFFSSLPAGVQLQNLVIENGAAKADFSDALQVGVGGSCRVSAIRAQITETLKQFSTVKDVIISINGRTEDILQP